MLHQQWKFGRTKRTGQPTGPGANSQSTSASSTTNSASPSLSSQTTLPFYDRRRSSASVDPLADLDVTATPRRASTRSNVLDIHASPALQRKRSEDRRSDPLGLTVLYAPEADQRVVDILFIHGLGGTSLRTWCKNKDLSFLWPQAWLPEEADLATARILTFGYNAHFSAKKQQAALTINDFATDLLYNMKYSSDITGDKMGDVPIVIVAHSMGGLVFKKACKCVPALNQ